MDLDLDFDGIGRPGRQALPLAPSVVREVDEADLALLAGNRQTKPIPLKRISDRHHALARVIAAGGSNAEAAAIMGLEPSRVSVLCADPAFQELLALYRSKVDLAYADTLDHIAGLSKESVLELRNRLEEDPEGFSNSMLLEVFKTTADRSGHGPTSTSVNINANLADRLDAARKRALEARQASARDITPSTEGAG